MNRVKVSNTNRILNLRRAPTANGSTLNRSLVFDRFEFTRNKKWSECEKSSFQEKDQWRKNEVFLTLVRFCGF